MLSGDAIYIDSTTRKMRLYVSNTRFSRVNGAEVVLGTPPPLSILQ